MPLHFAIASAGDRVTAFLLDSLFIFVLMIVASLGYVTTRQALEGQALQREKAEAKRKKDAEKKSDSCEDCSGCGGCCVEPTEGACRGPSPVPWLRLGLANTLALAALYLYDGRAAWTVSLARVGIGALLLGRLFSPGFWLALTGAIVATSVMIIVHRSCGRYLSAIGVSATGAAGHALGQLLAARLLIIQHEAIWQIAPLFLFFTVFSGVLTGWLATLLLERLAQHPAFQTTGAHPLN